MAKEWKKPVFGESQSRLESLAKDIFAQHVRTQPGFEMRGLAVKAIEAAEAFYAVWDQRTIQEMNQNGAQ